MPNIASKRTTTCPPPLPEPFFFIPSSSISTLIYKAWSRRSPPLSITPQIFQRLKERDLDPVPVTLDAALAQISKGGKGSGAEIEASPDAAGAAVDNGGLDRAAVVVDADATAAERVVVGVAVGGAGVELLLVQGDDVLAVVVPPAAGTEAGVVPGEGAAGAGLKLGGRGFGGGGCGAELEEGEEGGGHEGLGEVHFV